MYRITDTKTYQQSAENLQAAMLAAVKTLEGKIAKQKAGGTGKTVVKFHKTVLGKVLGDRSHFELTVQPTSDGSQLDVLAYPLDAIGRELKFGARKGVTKTLLSWLHAHIDHQLAKQSTS